MRIRYGVGVAVVAVAVALAVPACAEEPEFTLNIKDHHFDPAELQVPAGVKVRLIVKNLDATPEEFESNELHREKVVAPGHQILVIVGPLDPGAYEIGRAHV